MGQSPPGTSYNETNNGKPFLQGKAEFGDVHPKNIKYTTGPKKIAPSGSILMSVRAPVGDVNVADMEYCIGRGLAAISFKNGDNEFLFFLLQHLKDEIEKEGTGSIFKSINKAKLSGFEIPLPPLPEQHAIATTLRTVQEAKERTDAMITATKAFKAAMMKHLFTYGPVPPEEAERVVLKETEIGPVPEGWKITSLGKIAHVGNGSTPKRDNPSYWENGTIPWITSTKVHDSVVTHADFFITESAIRECHLPLVKKGSLIVAITGQGKTLGNTALLAIDTRVNQHLAYVEFKSDDVEPEFMLRFMQSRYQQLRDVGHGSGSTKGALTCGYLKTFPVPLPSRNDQKMMAKIFSTIDQKLAAEQSRKEALETLFTSLLHDLMTAKIRVNPAEVA